MLAGTSGGNKGTNAWLIYYNLLHLSSTPPAYLKHQLRQTPHTYEYKVNWFCLPYHINILHL